MNVIIWVCAILLIFAVSFSQEYAECRKEIQTLSMLLEIKDEELRNTGLVLFLEKHPKIAKQIHKD